MRTLVVGRGAALDAVLDTLNGSDGLEVTVAGPEMSVMTPIDLPGDAERSVRIDAIMGAARGRTGELAWDDPAWGLLDAVASHGAVVLAGGELASRNPGQMAESLLFARLATSFHKPLVLVGQTVGALGSQLDLEHVVELLSSASLVTFADDMSYDWAVEHAGAAAASFRRALGGEAALALRADHHDAVGDAPYTLVDLQFAGRITDGAFAELMRAFVDRAAGLAGARPVVIDDNTATLDGVEMLAVPAGGRRASAVSATAVLTDQVDLAVAAAVAGVPVLAVAFDADTDRILAQALGDFGLAEAVVPVAAVATGDAADTAEAMLQDHRGRATAALVEQRRVEDRAAQDELCAVLRGGAAALAVVAGVDQAELVPTAARLRVAALRGLQQAADADTVGRSASDGDLSVAAARVDALRSEVQRIVAERDAALVELGESQLALRAAHGVVADAERHLRPTRARTSIVVDAERQTRRAVTRIVRKVSDRLGAG